MRFTPIRYALALLTMVPCLTAADKAGTADASFGDQGMAIIAGNPARDLTCERGFKCVRQPDGKTVVTGDFQQEITSAVDEYARLRGGSFVSRYLPDGTADPSFGAQGIGTVMLPLLLSHRFPVITSLALQEDGKIVVGAVLAPDSFFVPIQDVALVRLLPDGSLDSTFGTGGIALSTMCRFHNVVILPDGGIAIGGSYGNTDWDQGGLLMRRFLSDGRVDTSFGVNGLVDVPRPTISNGFYRNDFLRQPDGRYLIHSISLLNANTRQWTITRLNEDGTLDTAFGANGSVGLDYGNIDFGQCGSVAVMPNGDIVMTVPRIDPRYSSGPFLARYSATGQFLGYFGTGVLTADYLAPILTGLHLSVLKDGTLIGILFDNHPYVYEFGDTLTRLATNFVSPGDITPTDDGGFLIVGRTPYGQNVSNNMDSQVTQYNRAGTVTQTYIDKVSTRFPTAAATSALGVRGGDSRVQVRTAVLDPTPFVPNQSWEANLNAAGGLQSVNESFPQALSGFVHITQGPDGINVLKLDQAGWLKPWPYNFNYPARFARPKGTPAAADFSSVTCTVENDLGEVFVGGQQASRGVVRRFGLSTVKHYRITGTPATDVSSVAALAERDNGGLLVLLRLTATGNGRLVRLTPTMTADASFGVKGQINFTGFDVSMLNQGALAVLPNERVLIAQPGVSQTWQVACYLPKGTPADDFGIAGLIQTPFLRNSSGEPRAIYLRALPSGGLLIAGATAKGFALGRWDRHGVPDVTFGDDGLSEIENGLDLSDAVNGLTIDALNGQIFVAGATMTSATSAVSDAFAARFLPDPVAIRLTNPRAFPVAMSNHQGSTQKFTVTNNTGVDQSGVKVRLHGLPPGVILQSATRLPEVGSWELLHALTLPAGAMQQITVTYTTPPISRGRFWFIPAVPTFVPLLEAVTAAP